MFKSPPIIFYLWIQGDASLWILFVIYVSPLSLSCLLVCSLLPCDHLLGNNDLFSPLCVMFTFVFVTFPYGFLGQAWYFIVSISDICLFLYFHPKPLQNSKSSVEYETDHGLNRLLKAKSHTL